MPEMRTRDDPASFTSLAVGVAVKVPALRFRPFLDRFASAARDDARLMSNGKIAPFGPRLRNGR